jgi:hypothetical protein
VTTINFGDYSRLSQFSKDRALPPSQVNDEAQAAWQRFLEALAARIVREERQRMKPEGGQQ